MYSPQNWVVHLYSYQFWKVFIRLVIGHELLIIHDKISFSYCAKSALRGEAALRARLPNEAKRNASISPNDRVQLPQSHWFSAFEGQSCEHHPPCVGDLWQLTRKGNNNKDTLHYSQVLILKRQKYIKIGICLSLFLRLLCFTFSGVLRWKHVSVYINKKCQVY